MYNRITFNGPLRSGEYLVESVDKTSYHVDDDCTRFRYQDTVTTKLTEVKPGPEVKYQPTTHSSRYKVTVELIGVTPRIGYRYESDNGATWYIIKLSSDRTKFMGINEYGCVCLFDKEGFYSRSFKLVKELGRIE